VQTQEACPTRSSQGSGDGRTPCDWPYPPFVEYLDGARSRSKRLLLSSADFKAFIVGVHHDRLHVTAVEFPEKYFEWVARGDIPQGELLVIRRTKTYDLSKPDARIEASRMIIGMMRYINRD
jgi:hypothetical protein